MGNKNTSTLRGDIARLRALAMLKRKVMNGITNKQLAQEFNVSIMTVERGLAKATKEGIIEKFEADLLNDLVPEAMKAVKHQLAENNATVALEILKGAGILKKPRDMNKIAEGGDGDSLEVYIRAKRAKQLGTVDRQSPDGAPALPGVRELPALPAAPSAEEGAPGIRQADEQDGIPPGPEAGDLDGLVLLEGEFSAAPDGNVDED